MAIQYRVINEGCEEDHYGRDVFDENGTVLSSSMRVSTNVISRYKPCRQERSIALRVCELHFRHGRWPLSVYIKIYGIQRVVNHRYLSGNSTISTSTFPGRPSYSDHFHLRKIARATSILNGKCQDLHHTLLLASDVFKSNTATSRLGEGRPGPDEGHRHFGLMDGIVQPAVKGITKPPPPRPLSLNAGSILSSEKNG
ncbi:hypothetical protein ARMGADRAFT_1035296 [Armillaria gallica]|uniref:Uncharacterized protein n=1 Tax=Armillaria gallica TaxID=47427 RepID=A0A2H3CUL6_ARMGA|nr:hypothetical protein ARMGADRAFT_1035296 [Armillaria gallica]